MRVVNTSYRGGLQLPAVTLTVGYRGFSRNLTLLAIAPIAQELGPSDGRPGALIALEFRFDTLAV